MKRTDAYVLLAELGRGGMATVHLARRADGAGPIVACKALLPHLADDDACRGRFLDEARLMSRIAHPNVVRVLGVGEQGGALQIAMEYVLGASLSELSQAARKRGERVPLPVASSLVWGALAGLHAAHEAREEDGRPLAIVHRDVTPRNIMVGVDGSVRLLDFGIARAAVRSVPATTTGHVRGTPGYMAPEQARGGVLTRGADIFLAGILLWELVTGRRLNAHCMNEAQFLLQLVEGSLPRAVEIVPDLAPAVAAVIDQAMALTPAARFETAEAMARALAAAVAPAPREAVAAWVRDVAADLIARRADLVARAGAGAAVGPAAPPEGSDGGTETGPAFAAWSPGQGTTLPLGAVGAPGVPGVLGAPLALGAPEGADSDAAMTRLYQPAAPSQSAPAPLASTSRRARVVGGAAALLTGATVALFALRGPSPSTPAEGSADPATPSIASTSSVEAPSPAPTALATPSATATAVTSPSSSAAALAQPPPAASAPTTPTTSARPRPRPAAARCNPPTYVDSRGVIRIKEGCSGR